jgi:Trypsin-like peptidase domain
MRNCPLWYCVFAGTFLLHGNAGEARAQEINQDAMVSLTVKCLDKNTGAIRDARGTGFIVSKEGYVLTAHHVLACTFKDGDTLKELSRTGIFGRIGSIHEPPERQLEPVRLDAQGDVAVLKIRGTSQYPSLALCIPNTPKVESTFSAAGFPEDSDYQPITGIVGNNNALGGRWAAAAPFVAGMSGGPVVQNGHVVGLIKGGRENVEAIRTITPLFLAKSAIESSGAVNSIAACGTAPGPNGNIAQDGNTDGSASQPGTNVTKGDCSPIQSGNQASGNITMNLDCSTSQSGNLTQQGTGVFSGRDSNINAPVTIQRGD